MTESDGGRAIAATGGVAGGAGHATAGASFAGGAGVATAGNGASTWVDPPDPEATAAAYQVNSAHTGAQPMDHLTVPLSTSWSHDFGTPELSYPLIARGRVFIVAGNALFALDLATGAVAWGPHGLGEADAWANPAYERGRIFTVDTGTHVQAVSADDGKELWSVTLADEGGVAFRKPIPAVYDGIVYFAAENKLFAVDGASGSVKWTLRTETCWSSGAAVGPAGAFVGCLCGFVYGADARTGEQRWTYPGVCTGGGGGVPVLLAGGFVYTRDQAGNIVFDAATGAPVGVLATGPIPAAAGDSLYAVNDGVLFAHRKDAADPVWTFGDGHLTTAPLVVGKHVVVGDDAGALTVLDAQSGDPVSQVTLPAPFPIPADDWYVETPLSGLNAAEDRLVVPNGTGIWVY